MGLGVVERNKATVRVAKQMEVLGSKVDTKLLQVLHKGSDVQVLARTMPGAGRAPGLEVDNRRKRFQRLERCPVETRANSPPRWLNDEERAGPSDAVAKALTAGVEAMLPLFECHVRPPGEPI
jgi:hypothetical protein